MTVHYKVPDNKKKRIIMDTDAACEADDPFAIAHGLMCQMFDIKGIVAEHREFNAGNDIYAINLVVSSGVEFWQIPNNVYGTMHIGIAEIERRIRPCGAIGRHLFDQLNTYNQSEMAGWTAGESWSLGDSPAVGVVLEPNCGSFDYRPAPVFLEDTSYVFPSDRPMIRVYRTINSRFIIEDFICKLDLYYGTL